MIIYKHASDITKYIHNQQNEGQKCGFVPTMGALHEGHISLVKLSKSENDFTICSIFVNPTQFNNQQDFEKYPSTIEQDILLLEEAGCDILFLPDIIEIYPADFKKQHYELGYLEQILEGKYRPGHFQGVCMVVERLLQIVPCNILYLGRKDYQQCMVIRKMVQLKNLNINIKEADTMRESDGLAMSSRNKRLSTSDREKSVVIFKTLSFIIENISNKTIKELKEESAQLLSAAGFNIDYVAITDSILNDLNHWDGKSSAVALIAASINDVRLIDNMII
jgi:pantoate--beta-alanine ligase